MLLEASLVCGSLALAGILLIYAAKTPAPGRRQIHRDGGHR